MGKTHSAAGALACAAILPPASSLLGMDLSPGAVAVGVMIGAVAGVLPDIDHPDSLVTHGIIPGAKKMGALGKALGWFLSIPPRIIGIGARATMNHRGGTHSLLFAAAWALLAAPIYGTLIAVTAIIIAPIWALTIGSLLSIIGIDASFTSAEVIKWLGANIPTIYPLVALSVFIGYLSHLITDAMTKVPVPFLWPLKRKSKKGKKTDYVRFFVLPKPMRITTDSPTENGFVRPAIYAALVLFLVLNVFIPMGQEIFSAGDKIVKENSVNSKEIK